MCVAGASAAAVAREETVARAVAVMSASEVVRA